MNNYQLQTCMVERYMKERVFTEYRSVTVRNEGSYSAQFSLSYVYKGKFYSNTSDKFKSHKSSTLQFPKGSSNLTVFVSYFYNTHESTFLYRENFSDFQNRCYLLLGTVTTASCQRTPCSCNNTLYQCSPCCICKCNYYM